jgi:glycosyltransferase involved in cell wall biosynthesis
MSTHSLNINKKPAVSICIPTCNRVSLLKIALESCDAQTCSDYEIVITDNSDNNDTLEFIKSLDNPKIRYHKNETNIGIARNLELCTSRGTGRYIKVLMDDDVLKPEALAEMTLAMEQNPNVGVVMAPLDIIDQAGMPINYRAYLIKKIKLLYRYRKSSQLIPKKTILTDFLTKEYPCCVPSGIMYRRECFDRLGPIDVNMIFITDVEVCARFATEYDFYYIDKPLCSWRYSPLSYTVTNLHQKGLDTEIYYLLTKKLCADPKVLALYSKEEMVGLHKKAYFFASKRAVLSILAGIRTMNFPLIFQTLGLMKKNDPYPSNLIALPFNIAREIFSAGISWLK